MICWLIATVPNQQPTINVAIHQPIGWLPNAISFANFVGLLWLGLFTLNRTRQDRVAERKAAWFQRVVLEHALVAVPALIAKITDILTKTAVQMEVSRAQGDRAALEQLAANGMQSCQAELNNLVTALTTRLRVVDAELARSFGELANQSEDSLSLWLEKFIDKKPYDQIDGLTDLISAIHVDMLQILFHYEFGDKNT